MSIELDGLRADFRTAAVWCLDCGEWSDADVAEIGQAIKAAVDARDTGYLAWWGEFMGRYAACVQAIYSQSASLVCEVSA